MLTHSIIQCTDFLEIYVYTTYVEKPGISYNDMINWKYLFLVFKINSFFNNKYIFF